jgi:sortase A
VKIGTRKRFAEVACYAVGAALIALYFSTRAYAAFERREGIAIFAQARTATGVAFAIERGSAVPDALWEGRSADQASPDQSRWSEVRKARYAAYAAAGSRTMPAAVLRISRVGLEVPVYADTSELNLNRGAVLVAGTAAAGSDGNIAIAAHRDGYFRALEDVAVGDVVELESLSRERRYRVTELAVVSPTDTRSLLDTGQAVITLVTCYPFYFVGNAPQRYIVRAVATD